MKKAVIAYFTRSGKSRQVAQELARITGGELCQVENREAYPEDYRSLVTLVMDEEKRGVKRPLAPLEADFSALDRLYIVSPNWFGTIVPPIKRLLEGLDLDGKEVALVITHGGSGCAKAPDDVIKLAPGARLVGQLALNVDEGGVAGKLENWTASL